MCLFFFCRKKSTFFRMFFPKNFRTCLECLLSQAVVCRVLSRLGVVQVSVELLGAVCSKVVYDHVSLSVQQRMLKRRCDVTSLRANNIDFLSRPFVFLPCDLNRRQLQLANVQCFADWCNVNLIDVCAEECIYEGWLLRIFLQRTT